MLNSLKNYLVKRAREIKSWPKFALACLIGGIIFGAVMIGLVAALNMSAFNALTFVRLTIIGTIGTAVSCFFKIYE